MAFTITTMCTTELTDFMSAFKLNDKSSIIYFPSIVTYNDGNIYKGEIKINGVKHGLGEMYYTNGDVFASRWVNDVSFGSGVYFSKNGTIYRGSWINNTFHGRKNTILFQNGNIYSGNVKNSCITGQGSMTYANTPLQDQDQIQDQIQDQDQDQDQDQVQDQDQDQVQDQEPGTYIGDFVCGQKCGYGVHWWPNGNVYNGGWKNDTFEGDGVLNAMYSHNAIYTGPWINGHQQDTGRIIFTNE